MPTRTKHFRRQFVRYGRWSSTEIRLGRHLALARRLRLWRPDASRIVRHEYLVLPSRRWQRKLDQ